VDFLREGIKKGEIDPQRIQKEKYPALPHVEIGK
jgi:hypothetical protein